MRTFVPCILGIEPKDNEPGDLSTDIYDFMTSTTMIMRTEARALVNSKVAPDATYFDHDVSV